MFWISQVTDYCPQQCLEWLAQQVTRNKLAHTWVLQNMEMWVEMYLMAHHNIRVRNAAAMLLVALVPNNNFRQAYRTSRTFISPNKDAMQVSVKFFQNGISSTKLLDFLVVKII